MGGLHYCTLQLHTITAHYNELLHITMITIIYNCHIYTLRLANILFAKATIHLVNQCQVPLFQRKTSTEKAAEVATGRSCCTEDQPSTFGAPCGPWIFHDFSYFFRSPPLATIEINVLMQFNAMPHALAVVPRSERKKTGWM